MCPAARKQGEKKQDEQNTAISAHKGSIRQETPPGKLRDGIGRAIRNEFQKLI